MTRSTLRDLTFPLCVTVLGLMLAFWLGYNTTGNLSGAFSFLLVGSVLAVLEISLSFDNAIVNANKLKEMSEVWQRRFLTWGILIAVFGMRIIFPLAVVAIAAKIGPIEAIRLAATDPDEYAAIISDAHVSIAAFGGTFLMMVALCYFIDEEKEVDWLKRVESRLRRCASVRGMAYGVVLCAMLIFTVLLPEAKAYDFIFAAAFGLVVFNAVDTLGHVLDARQAAKTTARVGGLGAFLYLEVLDASFSFDGVIGAFALTQNLFLIAIGLGIGAVYVRSMTIMLVQRQTLRQFRYLEHGAFYSIFVLSVIMYLQSIVHVPEVITGLIGAGMIGMSFISSVRFNRRYAAE